MIPTQLVDVWCIAHKLVFSALHDSEIDDIEKKLFFHLQYLFLFPCHFDKKVAELLKLIKATIKEKIMMEGRLILLHNCFFSL